MDNLNVDNQQLLERFVTPQWYFQYSRPAIRKRPYQFGLFAL